MLNKQPQISKRSTPIEIVHCITLAFWTYGIITPSGFVSTSRQDDGWACTQKKKKNPSESKREDAHGWRAVEGEEEVCWKDEKKQKKKKTLYPTGLYK